MMVIGLVISLGKESYWWKFQFGITSAILEMDTLPFLPDFSVLKFQANFKMSLYTYVEAIFTGTCPFQNTYE